MRFIALVAVLAVGCGGQVEHAEVTDTSPEPREEVSVTPDAPISEPVTPRCCELDTPSCGCTVVGTLADGTCSTVCDAKPVGWTRSIDERGCPKWNVAAGSCAPAYCPGTATSCGAGCAAVRGQHYVESGSCVTPEETAGCMQATGACTGAITCKVRTSDGALFRFSAGCPLDGWRECSSAEYTRVLSAPTCGAVDAG